MWIRLLILNILMLLSAQIMAVPLGIPYMNYEKFSQLSHSQQRDFIKTLMETAVYIEEAQLLQKAHNENDKKVVKAILDFYQKLSPIQSAYAGETEVGACLYAGWRSSYLTRNGVGPFCVTPDKSHDVELKRHYSELKKKSSDLDCKKANSVVCAPTLFGTKKDGSVSCGDNTAPHNASLKCFKKAHSDTARIDRIIQEILTNLEKRNEFKALLQMIFGICLCNDKSTEQIINGKKITIHEGYADYLFNHRTCYSLLAQTKKIIDRGLSNSDGCFSVKTAIAFEDLAQEMSFLNSFTHKVESSVAPSISREDQNFDNIYATEISELDKDKFCPLPEFRQPDPSPRNIEKTCSYQLKPIESEEDGPSYIIVPENEEAIIKLDGNDYEDGTPITASQRSLIEVTQKIEGEVIICKPQEDLEAESDEEDPLTENFSLSSKPKPGFVELTAKRDEKILASPYAVKWSRCAEEGDEESDISHTEGDKDLGSENPLIADKEYDKEYHVCARFYKGSELVGNDKATIPKLDEQNIVPSPQGNQPSGNSGAFFQGAP